MTSAQAGSVGVSKHLVAYAYATESRDPRRLVSCAERLAQEDGIAVAPRLAANLTALLGNSEDAPVKFLFNEFTKLGSAPPGSLNAALIAAAVYVAAKPAQFLTAFQLDKLPAFALVLASLERNDDKFYAASRSIIDTLYQEPKLNDALRGLVRLKEAKCVLNTWEDESTSAKRLHFSDRRSRASNDDHSCRDKKIFDFDFLVFGFSDFSS